MVKDDKLADQPIYGCHLGMAQYRGDTRTPEERQVAEAKESARRKGRGRKDWWKTETGKDPAR